MVPRCTPHTSSLFPGLISLEEQDLQALFPYKGHTRPGLGTVWLLFCLLPAIKTVWPWRGRFMPTGQADDHPRTDSCCPSKRTSPFQGVNTLHVWA